MLKFLGGSSTQESWNFSPNLFRHSTMVGYREDESWKEKGPLDGRCEGNMKFPHFYLFFKWKFVQMKLEKKKRKGNKI